MRNPADHGDIVQTYVGQGEITFPRGDRLQSAFQLVHYRQGQWVLTCTGRFARPGYPQWVRLVQEYKVDPRRPAAEQRWLAARYAGRTQDQRLVTIQQLYLVAADASGEGEKTLTLQMQFDCQDVTVGH
jgi:hypothetical protein